MKREADAIKKLCDYKSKVSSHYFIKDNGHILNLVPDLFEAWHAGDSYWKKNKFLNKSSIGIEINNPGHDNKYKDFSNKQISALETLLKLLIKKYNIKVQNILGHSDIAPLRKIDPGEKFPWKKLAKKKLCKWHDLIEKKTKKFRRIKLGAEETKKFYKNLHKFGYANFNKSKLKRKNFLLVNAFQRRFRQSLINGKVDKECLMISENLLK
jgi:N-acetylmuramoyl-L-alanine amidase